MRFVQRMVLFALLVPPLFAVVLLRLHLFLVWILVAAAFMATSISVQADFGTLQRMAVGSFAVEDLSTEFPPLLGAPLSIDDSSTSVVPGKLRTAHELAEVDAELAAEESALSKVDLALDARGMASPPDQSAVIMIGQDAVELNQLVAPPAANERAASKRDVTLETRSTAPIPDQYIVVLRDDVVSPRAAAADLASKHPVSVLHVYEHALKGFAARVPSGRLAALQADRRVLYVQPDLPVYASDLTGAAAPSQALNNQAPNASQPQLTPSPTTTLPKATAVVAPASGTNAAGALAVPANDNFGNSVSVTSVAQQFTQSTTEATTETGEPSPCAGIANTVWYTLRLPSTMAVTILTTGSSFDTALAAYTGSALTGLTNVACNDDFGGTLQSQIQFTATGGTAYRIQAGGFFGNRGTLTLRFEEAASGTRPPNDDFANAAAVTGLPQQFTLSTSAATTETGEPSPCARISNTVWYSLQLPSTTRVQIKTATSSFDTALVVYTGSSLPSLTQIVCDDDFGGLQSQVTFTATANTLYRVQVGGYTGSRGNLVVNFATPPPPPAQTAPTGVRRVGASTNGVNQTLPVKGTGIGVAVLDTGIDLAHPDLTPVQNGPTCIAGTPNANDDHAHGTHVAGTIGARDNSIGVVGIAPEVTLYAVKVLDEYAFGTTSSTICGIDWVTANASSIQVANMSLGYPGTATPSGTDCTNSNNDAMHTALCRSVRAGVTYAISAGNEAEDARNHTPAAYEEGITVSALADYNGAAGGGAAPTCRTLGSDDGFTTFSNYGPAVDIAAPGVCILSTFPEEGYGILSGTSMAAPHVAGMAALYRQVNRSATPAQVRAALIAGWEPGPIPGDPDTFPEGILRAVVTTPTATPTRTPLPTNTPTRTPPATATPYPRPNVAVAVSPNAAAGTLQTTITARDAACSGGNNRLVSLQVTKLTNATLTVATAPPTAVSTTPTTVALPGTPAAVGLTLQRVAPGQAATAELIVTDGCGTWPTFVGGGPTAF